MPITLNGTTGIQNVLGSASAPAESNTTSSNTGLYFPTSTTLGLSTNGTAALTIDASQNVGIGTSSPGTKLEVNGSIKLTPTLNGGLQINQSGGTINSFIGPSGFGGFAMGTQTTDNVILFSNNSERMRIDSSGNVGIGTALPVRKLQVGSVAAGGGFAVTGSAPNIALSNADTEPNANTITTVFALATSAGNYSLNAGEAAWLGVGDSRGNFIINPNYSGTGTKNLIIQPSSGNVGIGTSAPIGKLHVKAATDQNLSITGAVSLANAVVISAQNDAGTANIPLETRYASAASWYDAGTETLRMDNFIRARLQIGGLGGLNIATTIRTSTGGLGAVWAESPSGGTYVPFMTFHRPGVYASYFGLDNDNWFAVGGWSAGSGLANFKAAAISKSSGSFTIDHPIPEMSETHNLVHSFIEGPQADLIYRGKITLEAGKATVNVDTVSGMTDGTFVLLCRDVQCYTSNETGWAPVRGSIVGNILTIEAENNTCTDTISWLVIGERQDKHMYDTPWTDEIGKVIVEPLKNSAAAKSEVEV